MQKDRLRSLLSDLATSTLVTGAVAIVLGFESLRPEAKRHDGLILVVAIVGVLDAITSYVLVRRTRGQARQDGLLRDGLGDLTTSLGVLSRDRPQDWAAEILLAKGRETWRRGPFRRRLRRAAFHRLGSGLVLPASATERAGAPAAECLRTKDDVLWSPLTLPSGSANFVVACSAATTAELSVAAAACRCTLLMDRDERSVVGVLVVYLVGESPDLVVGTMETGRFGEVQRQAARTLGRLITTLCVNLQ